MTAPSLKQIALADVEQELATTRRVLDRVPDEHLEWKPHARSWSLGALATHLATLPTYGTAILGQDELDATTLPPNTLATSRDELLPASTRTSPACAASWRPPTTTPCRARGPFAAASR